MATSWLRLQSSTPCNPPLSLPALKCLRAILHDIETNDANTVYKKMGKSILYYAHGYFIFIHMVSPDAATRLRLKHP